MKGPGGTASCVQHMQLIRSLHYTAHHRLKAPPGRLLRSLIRAAEAPVSVFRTLSAAGNTAADDMRTC